MSRLALYLSSAALLLGVIGIVLPGLSDPPVASLPASLLITASAVGQLLWHSRRPSLASLWLIPVMLLLALALASYLIPEYWIAQATWDRATDRLIDGSLLVDWRPPLLVTLALSVLVGSLLLRTRANLGSPLLLGMASLLLIAQVVESLHPASPLALAGSSLEQAAIGILLLAQLIGVIGGWHVNRPSIERSLWPSLLLALCAMLFWHHQLTLAEREVFQQVQREHQRMADQLNREIDDQLAAMRRFSTIWQLLDEPPQAEQWHYHAAPYHRHFRYFLNIAYIDLTTRIRHVYPLTGINRSLVGTLLFNEQPAGREALSEALVNGREGRTGIVDLLQGEPGIIHYLPILDVATGQSRGAVAMVVSLPALVDTLFSVADTRALALSLHEGGTRFAERQASTRLGPWRQEIALTLDGESLTLVSQPTLGMLLARLPRLPVVSLVVGLVLSTLLYLVLFAHHQMSAQHRSVRLSNRELRREVRNRTQLQQEVEWLAGHDELTRLPNRRTVMHALEAEAEHRPMSLLLCDVDHFKRVNDRLGHLAGDHYLIRIAELGRSIVEPTGGLFARFGGEEFVAYLPGHDGDAAQEVAEHLRRGMQRSGLAHADETPLTMSIGIATLREGPLHIDTLLQAADDALYAAKAAGRNSVVRASPPVTAASSV